MQMDATLASLQIFTSRRRCHHHCNRPLILLIPPSRDDGREPKPSAVEVFDRSVAPPRCLVPLPPFACLAELLNGRLMSKWSADCSGLCLALFALLADLHMRRFLPGNTQGSRSAGHAVDHYRICTGFKNRGDHKT